MGFCPYGQGGKFIEDGRSMLEREKVLVEPSGAAGLAALFENRVDVKG